MSHFCFFLLLLVSFSAQAQDGSFYPDALALKGEVLMVKMYTLSEKGEKRDLADIEYVYDEGVRLIRTYDSFPDKKVVERYRMVEPLVKDPKHDKVIRYEHIYNRLFSEHYSFDENGNKTLSGQSITPGYKAVLSYDKMGRVIKRVMTNDHKAIMDITTYSYSNNGKTVQTVSVNALDKLKGKATWELDEHNNPIKYLVENANEKEGYVTKYKYTYDSHGNYTSYITTMNGQPAYSHYRVITYK